MGFIKEVYSDNRAGLVVVFRQGSTSSNYFDGDSVEAAMKYFNLYLKDNEMFIKTEDETAINNLGIEAKDAEEFRSSVDLILNSLDDEQAIQLPILFPLWKTEVEYKVDERIRYNNKIYKVLQNHTSQENWTPALAPSLFAALLIDEVNGTILEWIQPDSTNPYSNGDKVIHNQKFWISTADNNIWEPGALLTPWKEYTIPSSYFSPIKRKNTRVNIISLFSKKEPEFLAALKMSLQLKSMVSKLITFSFDFLAICYSPSKYCNMHFINLRQF